MSDAACGTLVDGRYRLERRVGKGGMGEIWRARRLADDAEVAVKLLHPSLTGDPELVARFEREIAHGVRIVHPNAVRVLGGGTPRGERPYLVMELLRGRPLSVVRANEAPMPAERVADLGRQIAAGLGAAHAVGVVHRDLKPGNVVVAKDEAGRDHATVFDFGLSLASQNSPDAARLTAVDLRIGTPEYMAPEYIGHGRLDAQADLYALGVVLYELACGALPFEGRAYQLMHAHLNREPPPLSSRCDAPAWLCEAVHALLGKDPDERPAGAEAAIARLAAPG